MDKGGSKKERKQEGKEGRKEIWNDKGNNMFVQKLGKLELGRET